METTFNNTQYDAKPFLKWAGGKKQLIPEIEDRLPNKIKQSKEIDNYFEPFIGAGAIFFYLMNNYEVHNAYISDINKELILCYNVIKKDPKKLLRKLKFMQTIYLKKTTPERKEYYLYVRNKFNKQLKNFDFKQYSEETIKRASYTIFMNKTGFNGLFRLNKKGEFNVPSGRYSNPLICNRKNILNVSKILQEVTIENKSYLESEKLINKNSLVYLDPPYRPLKGTSNFKSYTENDFGDKEQIELGQFYKKISNKGAKAILSNSDPKNQDPTDEFFDNLYADFTIERVKANRNINADGKKRGAINEIIVTNF